MKISNHWYLSFCFTALLINVQLDQTQCSIESDCETYCQVVRTSCPSQNGFDACVDDCMESEIPEGEKTDFMGQDTLSCRKNHAIMALKEGSNSNSDHCLHAQLPGKERCKPSLYVFLYSKFMELGKKKFYEGQEINSVLGVIAPIFYLIGLRGRLYVPYPNLIVDDNNITCADDETLIKYRTAEGICNNLDMPRMGAVGTPFVHNLEASDPHPEGSPSLSDVANLLQRPVDGQYDPARQAPFSQIAVAWIQFMTHDWFAHDKFEIGSPLHNQVTHWWDGSQLYGSNETQKESVRAPGGKLLLDENNEIDYDDEKVPITGFTDNFWVGLHVMHTIFAREHNYIVDQLLELYPTMTDDELFETARLCLSAVLAKIHTIEWTPTLLDNEISTFGLNVNWHGLTGAAENEFSDLQISAYQWLLDSIKAPSLGDEVAMYNSSFFMTEEFVAVYRMHSLLPDELTVQESNNTYKLNDLAFEDARTLESINTTERFLKSLGQTPAQLLNLDNYPSELYGLELPNGEGTVNLAEIDIMRDRARGLPRYNDARRQLLLDPLESIDDLTTDVTVREKLKAVYVDIDQVDLLVGCLVDQDRPHGFAFGIVPFNIFVVMASRRILSDRFFMDYFTAEYYTDYGIDYVNNNGLYSILARQFPEFESIMPENPFMNWHAE